MQAKQGAAVDLLGKLSKEFPNLGPFPEKVNEALLIKKSVWSTLKRKMQEENGGEFRFNFDTTSIEVNNHTLFRCILSMDTHIYEGKAIKYICIHFVTTTKTTIKFQTKRKQVAVF